MSRFSTKTYRSIQTGLAPLTYIDAECAEMAWVLHNGILRRPTSTHPGLVEVEDIYADLAAHDPSKLGLTRHIPLIPQKGPPILAMWRNSNAQYHWWLGGHGGQIQYVRNLCAVAVLARNPEGRFATVASVKREGKIGFPAGGVEFWETPFEAAARELEEETGLKASPSELIFLEATLIGGQDMVGYFWAPWYSGELQSSEEGIAAWSRPEVLLGEHGAYPDRNLWALSKLGVQVP